MSDTTIQVPTDPMPTDPMAAWMKWYGEIHTPRPTVNVKFERNSRSINYEVSVVGAGSPDEALKLLRQTLDKIKQEVEYERAPET